MRKIIKVPTLIGIIFLIAGITTGIILLQGRSVLKIGASPEFSPKELRVTNINDSSFTVSWITDVPTIGFIKYGENQGSLKDTATDETTGTSITHFAVIKNLKPQTGYFFKVNSQTVDYDSDGSAWTLTTAPAINSPQSSVVISGVIHDEAGLPKPNALVYAQVANSTALSTLTTGEGNWLITLSFARDAATLSSYVTIDPNNTLVEIFVAAGTDKVASAKILTGSAKPAPPIVLGQVHDFTSLTPTGTGEIPNASISLPIDNNPTSKFVVKETTPSASNSLTVTLQSQEEGEVVTTTTPQFFGDGPVGTSITILVESDPISDTVTVGSTGNWQWDPPKNLAPGEHKITLSWKDAQGILRTLTRSFIVQASEGPSFESSPSGTLKPSATPTSTPSATKKPTPTATSSAAPIPVTGDATPTILLLATGVVVVLFSIFVALLAF